MERSFANFEEHTIIQLNYTEIFQPFQVLFMFLFPFCAGLQYILDDRRSKGTRDRAVCVRARCKAAAENQTCGGAKLVHSR